MKTNFLILSLLSLFLISGCQKKELASPDQSRVINLKLTGVSTEILEFIYKGSVVASTTNASQFVMTTLLAVDGEDAKLDIRKKGATGILQSQTISGSLYNQNVSVYYDGANLYDGLVELGIKGYALSGELEFLSQGKVILSGTGVIDRVSNPALILINKGETRDIQVRKKGETEILYTKTIEASPSRQSLNFFFDGTSLVGNVALDPPVNPQNMMIRAKFETKFPNQFKKVDVDIVFYANNQTTKVATKISPEIRFTLAKDGSFNSIELPPLPGTNYFYSFDIFEKGTNNVPYSSLTTPLIPSGFPFVANNGRFGVLNFEAGKSKLFLIKDKSNLITTAPRGSALSGELTDLSQYCQ